VIVLIPGGGFFCGGSNDYDPISLVEQGQMVFVSLNYRLGLFGFFSHPAINAEDHAVGSYGIMDQQFALAWVQNNIEAFGGDPHNVTLMGESAGGISVMVHLAAPRSTGLFHRAIVQSGGTPPTVSYPSVHSLEERGVNLASAAGCTDQTPANLRLLSTESIMAANSVPKGSFGVGPFTVGLMEDGVVVPTSLRDKFTRGDFSRAPLLIGVNRDEFTWFQGLMEISTGNVIPAALYRPALAATLEAAAQLRILSANISAATMEDILQRYPLDTQASPGRAIATVVGDASIISTSGRKAARVIGRFVDHVYTYEFDVPDSPVSWPQPSFPYESGHAQELQFLFSQFHGGSGIPRTLNDAQQELSTHMVRYWTFARHGSPSLEGEGTGSSPPVWTPYSAREDNVMLLCVPKPSMLNGWAARHHCHFWDSLYL
jgi:para-nitrobenzyl esterase